MSLWQKLNKHLGSSIICFSKLWQREQKKPKLILSLRLILALVLISNLFQLEIEVYCEKRLWLHSDQVSEVKANNLWK